MHAPLKTRESDGGFVIFPVEGSGIYPCAIINTVEQAFAVSKLLEIRHRDRGAWPANPPPIPRNIGGGMTERVEMWRELGAKSYCVSADDPRLKPN